MNREIVGSFDRGIDVGAVERPRAQCSGHAGAANVAGALAKADYKERRMQLESDRTETVHNLKAFVGEFSDAREWRRFHSPKNLAMALSVEASELLELFQWEDNAQSEARLEKDRAEVEAELADIAAYLLEFCRLYGVDLSTALQRKREQNERKYPLNQAKGRSDKYTAYDPKRRAGGCAS